MGILGGTFNPIHMGHLILAQAALEEFELDKIVFVPAFIPPHKNTKSLISASERLHMVKLAIKDNTSFEVSDFEIKKGGKSYSVDTVLHFKKNNLTDTKIFFIIGYDNYTTLHKWKRIDELKKEVVFVTAQRNGLKKSSGSIRSKFLKMPIIDISSSAIRQKIAYGDSIRYLVPEKVNGYIQRKKLYQN